MGRYVATVTSDVGEPAAHPSGTGQPDGVLDVTHRRPRHGRRWLRGLLALVLALIGVGLIGGSLIENLTDDEAVAPPPRAETGMPLHDRIAASELWFSYLVTKRARAVQDGDLDAYLADLDPAAKELIASQTTLFENLAKLPLGAIEYVAGRYIPPKPATPDDFAGEWRPTRAYVESRIQLDEVDPRPAVAEYRYDLVYQDGRLLITGIGPSDITESPAPAPWETTQLAVARSDHMLVLATPEVAERAGEIANAAERAFDLSRSMWPEDGIRSEFVIFVTKDRELFESWYGDAEFVTGDTTGWARGIPTCCGSGGEKVLGDIATIHIAIDLTDIGDRIDLEWLLAHELTHAVAEPLGPADSDVALTWADEGYAEFVGVTLLDSYSYVANWDRIARSYARSDDFNGKLPADDGFYEDSEVNYALSVRFFEFLADRYDTSTVRDFYFSLNAMAEPDVDAAMRQYFDAPEEKLVGDWAEWVQR